MPLVLRACLCIQTFSYMSTIACLVQYHQLWIYSGTASLIAVARFYSLCSGPITKLSMPSQTVNDDLTLLTLFWGVVIPLRNNISEELLAWAILVAVLLCVCADACFVFDIQNFYCDCLIGAVNEAEKFDWQLGKLSWRSCAFVEHGADSHIESSEQFFTICPYSFMLNVPNHVLIHQRHNVIPSSCLQCTYFSCAICSEYYFIIEVFACSPLPFYRILVKLWFDFLHCT